MSLEKRFGVRLVEGDLMYLRMNDGSEILGRYRSEDKTRRQDNFYFDGVVIVGGSKYKPNGRVNDCMRLKVREVKSTPTMLDEEKMGLELHLLLPTGAGSSM